MSTESRFPQPEFTTAYGAPSLWNPLPRAELWQWVDIALLAGALVLAAHLVHRRRSRWGVFTLMLGSLFYFGFYRRGCLCPVGSIQNVSQGLFTPDFIPSWPALLIFLLPLLAALWWGRVFCAGVCPLGALQDLVGVKPIQVPQVIDSILRVIPVVYLSVAVLYADTGGAYLICKLDPFVSFFRFGGNLLPVTLGVSFLLIGTVVARPYCRYFCPYGVLLGLFSRVAKRRVAITPSGCTQCRLCEKACPYGALRLPNHPPLKPRGPSPLVFNSLLLTGFLLAGALLGLLAGPGLHRLHPAVVLAARLTAEKNGTAQADFETRYFHKGSVTLEAQVAKAESLRGPFRWGGAMVGMATGLWLWGALRRRRVSALEKDHHTDGAHCLACARCMEWCPEHFKETSRLEKNIERGRRV